MYPANWSITASDITNLPAGATATIVDNMITIASFDLAANAGCSDVSFSFVPQGPSGAADLRVDLIKEANGVCGDQFCSRAETTMKTSLASIPAPVLQTTKSVLTPGDEA